MYDATILSLLITSAVRRHSRPRRSRKFFYMRTALLCKDKLFRCIAQLLKRERKLSISSADIYGALEQYFSTFCTFLTCFFPPCFLQHFPIALHSFSALFSQLIREENSSKGSETLHVFMSLSQAFSGYCRINSALAHTSGVLLLCKCVFNMYYPITGGYPRAGYAYICHPLALFVSKGKFCCHVR